MPDKKAKVVEMLNECMILRSFGSKYFVCATLVPNICKVKVDMVEIGKNGKNANVIYLDIELFRQMFEELDNGIFVAKIKADQKEQYPKAYEFVTGDGGSKILAVGSGSKKGCIALQTRIKKGESYDNRIMAVSMNDIYQASFLFKLCLGLIPTVKGSYYDNLRLVFEKGLKEKEQYFSKIDSDLEPQEQLRQIVSSENDIKSKQNETNAEKDTCKSYELTITGRQTDQKGFVIFPAVTDSKKKYKVMFRKGETDNITSEIAKRLNNEKVKISIEAEEKNGYLLYKEGKVA